MSPDGRQAKRSHDDLDDVTWWRDKLGFFSCGYAPDLFPGRSEQQRFLGDHAKREDSSVVFIYGPPGTGKTALVMNQTRKHYSEQATLHLSCSSIRSPRQLLDRLVKWIGCESYESITEQWEHVHRLLIPTERRGEEESEEGGEEEEEDEEDEEDEEEQTPEEALNLMTVAKLTELARSKDVKLPNGRKALKVQALLDAGVVPPGCAAQAPPPQRRCLVLDELDFFLTGNPNAARLVDGNIAVTERSKCITLVDDLVARVLHPSNKTLFLVLISNAELVLQGPLAKVPEENRMHFAPYAADHLTQIVEQRLNEASTTTDAMFQTQAVRLLVMKALKTGGGDCRSLLEHFRLAIDSKSRKVSTGGGASVMSVQDAAMSAPQRDDMLLWLRAMSDNARLFVIACLALKKRGVACTLSHVSAAFKKIHMQSIGEAPDGSAEQMQQLLTELAGTHDFVVPAGSGAPATRRPTKAARKAPSNADIGSRVVEVKPSLTPDLVYAALRAISREAGEPDFLLGDVLRNHFSDADLS